MTADVYGTATERHGAESLTEEDVDFITRRNDIRRQLPQQLDGSCIPRSSARSFLE